jgi:DNA-directed RNA polymerase specialized sigma24 family protein
MGEGEREGRRRFDALFASYSSDIVAYCGWRAASSSDAQDAAAEVFLRRALRDEARTGTGGTR